MDRRKMILKWWLPGFITGAMLTHMWRKIIKIH